jgi:hypothetical protein
MNFQDIIRETYDTDLKAQKSSLISASTIYAVVNTAAVGVQNALTTINPGPNQIGSVTISNQLDIRSLNSTSTIYAVVNTTASGDPKTFIGLTTSVIGSSPTIYAVVNTAAQSGNMTLNPSDAWIGLVSVSGNLSFAGNVTLDEGSKTQIVGNLTLSDSKGFIGLTTTVVGNAPILSAGTSYIGLVTNTPVRAWPDPKAYIGLTTSTIGNGTLYAVVNTAAAGVQDSLATLNAGPNQIGSVTVSNTVPVTFSGNVTLDDGSLTGLVAGENYIGLASVNVGAGQSWIGLTTSTISNPTLYAVVNTAAAGVQDSLATLNAGPNQIGSVTVSNTVDISGLVSIEDEIRLADNENWIGLVSVSGFQNPLPVTFSGNVTLDDGSLTGLVAGANYIGLASVQVGVGAATIGIIRQAGPVTIAASPNYIGLASVNIGAGAAYIGLVSASVGVGSATIGIVRLASPMTIGASQNYIGLVSASLGVGAATIGIVRMASPVTVAHGFGNVTLNPSKSFIGLVTSTVGNTARTITGNLTLSDSKGFIGLTTIIPTYLSTYTSLATIISTSGAATIAVPPADKRWIVKDMVFSSLATAQVSVLSGAKTIIPPMYFYPAGGAVMNYGDSGLRASLINESLVVSLNGAASVAFMVNMRFE